MRKMIVVLLLVLLSLGLFAEEKNFKPFQFGVGASTGMTNFVESYVQDGLWVAGILHMTPHIVVRPKVLVYSNNRDRKNKLTDTTDHYEDTVFGAGVDLLYYWTLTNNMFFYTGPSVRYYYYSEKDEYASGGRGDDVTSNIMIGIKVGGQFMLGSNFGFYGDFGFGVESVTDSEKEWNSSDVLTTDRENSTFIFTTIGARLGAVFYIN